jgi:hypothetical protein
MKSLKMLLRFAIVGGLILLLLVPLTMIRGVINERSAYRDEAFSGGRQPRRCTAAGGPGAGGAMGGTQAG